MLSSTRLPKSRYKLVQFLVMKRNYLRRKISLPPLSNGFTAAILTLIEKIDLMV